MHYDVAIGKRPKSSKQVSALEVDLFDDTSVLPGETSPSHTARVLTVRTIIFVLPMRADSIMRRLFHCFEKPDESKKGGDIEILGW